MTSPLESNDFASVITPWQPGMVLEEEGVRSLVAHAGIHSILCVSPR